MTFDVCALVRRDHDDLDNALAAMVEPATPPKELTNLLDVFRLALAVHTAAEAKVLDLLVDSDRRLTVLATSLRVEHISQRATADALVAARPGSIGWYDGALELRVLVLDHAARSEQLRWTLEDYVTPPGQRRLAALYATERLRVLASTSPLVLAMRRDTIVIAN